MKSSRSAGCRVATVLGVTVIAGLLWGLLSSFTAIAQSGVAPPAPMPTQASTQPLNLDAWRKNMTRVPLPRKGCFTSSYPSAEWREVSCRIAPAVPNPPARGPRPVTVGNGADVSAKVTGLISTAVGSFDSVTGVTSETGQAYGQTGQVANAFTLQLNANTFTSKSACSGAVNPSACRGWQQFVYSNVSCPGCSYMQYWLLGYGTTNCPSSWISYNNYGDYECYTNSSAVFATTQTIANLINLSVTGTAVSGGMDTLILSTGSALYSVQNEDSVVNLSQGWQNAEFNIVGDCCDYEANFNSGSTIVVRASVDYGNTNAPSCLAQGFTGETNNLSFANAPTAQPNTYPAVVFTESSAGGASSPCASAALVGATAPLMLTATPSATTQAGQAYSQTNIAGGGTTPYVYSVSSGALPAGTSSQQLDRHGLGNADRSRRLQLRHHGDRQRQSAADGDGGFKRDDHAVAIVAGPDAIGGDAGWAELFADQRRGRRYDAVRVFALQRRIAGGHESQQPRPARCRERRPQLAPSATPSRRPTAAVQRRPRRRLQAERSRRRH